MCNMLELKYAHVPLLCIQTHIYFRRAELHIIRIPLFFTRQEDKKWKKAYFFALAGLGAGDVARISLSVGVLI
jgi:hypothetical protein